MKWSLVCWCVPVPAWFMDGSAWILTIEMLERCYYERVETVFRTDCSCLAWYTRTTFYECSRGWRCHVPSVGWPAIHWADSSTQRVRLISRRRWVRRWSCSGCSTWSGLSSRWCGLSLHARPLHRLHRSAVHSHGLDASRQQKQSWSWSSINSWSWSRSWERKC